MEKKKDTYMEDLRLGQTFASTQETLVTPEMIVAFAQQYDPQPFHTDPVAAKDTLFGTLVASGWHTAALTMRMMVENMPQMKGGLVGRQVEKISWPRPVYPGDKLSYLAEVIDMRASVSNPQRGVIRTKNTTFNQKGEVVMEMETVIFVPRRSTRT